MELTAGVARTSDLDPSARSSAVGQILAWLTVERALYAVALVAAVVIRFYELGRLPLEPTEAAIAWPAWLTANGLAVENAPTPSSPLLYALLMGVMWFGAAGDALARLPGALAGIGLVLVAWGLRDWLGRPWALAFALLIAIDPWTTVASRWVSGAVPALVLLLAIGACIAWAVREGRRRLLDDNTGDASASPIGRRAAAVIGVYAGLLLTSGPSTWTAVPVAALWLLLYRRELAAAKIDWATSARWAALTAALASTLLLTQLDGIGLISHSLTVWIAAFTDGGRSLGWFVTQLFADALPLAIGGGIGLIGLAAARADETAQPVSLRDGRWRLLLTVWLAWGVFVAALSGSAEALPFVAVPLVFGAAHLAASVVRMPPPETDWREALAVIATLTVLLSSGAIWIAALVSEARFAMPVALAVLSVLALGVVIAYLYGAWAGGKQARWLLSIFGVTLMALFIVNRSWQLSHVTGIDLPSGLREITTNPEARQLAEDIKTLSAHIVGDDGEMPVVIDLLPTHRPDAVLGWYLRGMRRLSWYAMPLPDGPRLFITSGTALSESGELAHPGVPEDYRGSTYAVASRWTPEGLTGPLPSAGESTLGTRLQQWWDIRLRPFLRWIIYRETRSLPESTNVNLWAPGNRY